MGVGGLGFGFGEGGGICGAQWWVCVGMLCCQGRPWKGSILRVLWYRGAPQGFLMEETEQL